MKKLFLSLAVIFSFAIYGIFTRKSTLATGVAPVNSGLTLVATPGTSSPATNYKNGQYTGDVTDAFYGNVQVQATVAGGKITDVTFLQYPSDRSRSININSQAMPYLKQEAIAAQSASVDIVSGATATSQAFISSLASALNQAK
jgi:uncharacterized protein with FMN-binding domain